MQKISLPKALGAFLYLALCAVFAQFFALQNITTTLPDYAYAAGFPQPETQSSSALNASNYLADVTQQGNFTWPLNQMPLRVYIEDGTGTPGYIDGYQDYIRRAFNEWQSITNSALTWVEVNSPVEANIICSWTAEARPKGGGVEAGETQTTIQRSPFFPDGRIVRAHVVVLTCLFGRPFSNADIYKTCLHEIGHALGLQGHSSTASDIMFPVLNANQTPFLKERDRNTIMALYERINDRSTIAMRPTPRRQPYGGGGYPPMTPVNRGWSRGFIFGNFPFR
ncbi:MAG TPA: matrixin family metalloprotease [Drouetiella sp.]|jgi:predicted Zn-dependent protease